MVATVTKATMRNPELLGMAVTIRDHTDLRCRLLARTAHELGQLERHPRRVNGNDVSSGLGRGIRNVEGRAISFVIRFFCKGTRATLYAVDRRVN